MELEAEWLTLAEIARRLGRRLSTLGSRRDAYRVHLDVRRDGRGHALYRLDAFEAMDRLMAERAGQAEIGRALDALREQAPAASRDDLILAELRAIREAVERIADRLERDD